MNIFVKGSSTYYQKTDIPTSLRPFYGYIFSSGPVIDDDFKSFNTKFKNFIKKNLPTGYEIFSWNRGHYYCSGVIKTINNNYIYISIGDVRWHSDWLDNILIREMEHPKDWTGKTNNYTSLFTFKEDIKKLWK